jgi:hypothetical protein
MPSAILENLRGGCGEFELCHPRLVKSIIRDHALAVAA